MRFLRQSRLDPWLSGREASKPERDDYGFTISGTLLSCNDSKRVEEVGVSALNMSNMVVLKSRRPFCDWWLAGPSRA